MKFLKTLAAAAALALSGQAFALDLTNFAENRLTDTLFRGQALGAPATWHIGLDTAACTEAGGGTEVSGGSYARVAVVASLVNWAGTQAAASTVASTGTSGTTSNNGAITFPTPSATWGNVVSVRWFDASTAGNAWVCTPLTVPKVINSGDTVSFPAATLSFQIDN
jgi:hypothetical protein